MGSLTRQHAGVQYRPHPKLSLWYLASICLTKSVASALGDLSGRQEADQAKNRPFQESVHPADQASSGSTYNPALPGWPYSFLFTKVIFFLFLFSHMKVTETNGGKVINENSWWQNKCRDLWKSASPGIWTTWSAGEPLVTDLSTADENVAATCNDVVFKFSNDPYDSVSVGSLIIEGSRYWSILSKTK